MWDGTSVVLGATAATRQGPGEGLTGTVPSHRYGLCLKGDFLSSEEKLVHGDVNDGRDSRDDEDSRDSGVIEHQKAPQCQAQTNLSHTP